MCSVVEGELDDCMQITTNTHLQLKFNSIMMCL